MPSLRRRGRDLCSFFLFGMSGVVSDQPSFISESPGGFQDSEIQRVVTCPHPAHFRVSEGLLLSGRAPRVSRQPPEVRDSPTVTLSLVHRIAFSLPLSPPSSLPSPCLLSCFFQSGCLPSALRPSPATSPLLLRGLA